MAVTVDELITEPFLNRTRADKERIVSGGKPRPYLLSFDSIKNRLPLEKSSLNSSNDEKANIRIKFDSSCYDTVEWLTGCDKKQTLFCWPCLLFRVSKMEWNFSGIHELSWSEKTIKNHEKNMPHIQCMLDLHLFSQAMTVNKPPEISPNDDSDLIKRNREIVKRVIDVVCFLVNLQQPPRAGTSDKNRLQIEDCLENVQFLRDYDILHANLIDDATDMLQITPKKVTDIIDALTKVVLESIREESNESSYVSLIFNDHATEPWKSQLSTVLRYVVNGEVRERFVGFVNNEGHNSYQNVVAHVKKIAADYLVAERIIAYSLDGSVLHSPTSMADLKNELKFRYPLVNFLPCHSHKLDVVLQQCFASNQDTEYFFKNLKALGFIFQEGSKMCEDFQTFREGAAIPNLDISNAASYLEFFKSLKATRKCVVDFFDYVMHHPDNVTSENLIKIYGLQTFLLDFKTVFLVAVFAKLYDVVSPLTQALSQPTPYGAFDAKLVDSVLENFQHDLAYYEAFEILWEEAIQERSEPDCGLFSDTKAKNRKKYAFHKIFSDLVKCTSGQIKCRLEDAAKLKFLAILDMESSSEFSDTDLESLCQECSTFFDSSNSPQLMKEIKLFNSNKNNVRVESVHNLLKLLKNFGLDRAFGNLIKLSEIMLTMPFTSVSASQGSSKLKVIQNWCYSAGKYEIEGDMSVLCVERDYLAQLSKKESFYDDVIRHFSDINKTMLLVNNTGA